MKRIFTTISQKWPEYLLEILVITIGILGAYSLNNWNDQRTQRALEKELLLQLKEELVADKELFTEMGQDHADVSQHIRDVLTALKNDLPLTDTLLSDFQRMTMPFGFLYSKTTYENLSNIGFHTIENRELRTSIQQLYNKHYNRLDGAARILSQEFLLTINVQQQQHLIIGDWETRKGQLNAPRDYEALKGNFVFQNTFDDAASQHRMMHWSFKSQSGS